MSILQLNDCFWTVGISAKLALVKIYRFLTGWWRLGLVFVVNFRCNWSAYSAKGAGSVNFSKEQQLRVVNLGWSMNRRKTIIDVAKECGLSQATVARVLNGQQDIQVKEKTRKRVINAAQKIGYRRNTLAANFRRQQSNTIAISIPDITNPFFPKLIKGIQEKMRDREVPTKFVD